MWTQIIVGTRRHKIRKNVDLFKLTGAALKKNKAHLISQSSTTSLCDSFEGSISFSMTGVAEPNVFARVERERERRSRSMGTSKPGRPPPSSWRNFLGPRRRRRRNTNSQGVMTTF